jgi:hypothetical protein
VQAAIERVGAALARQALGAGQPLPARPGQGQPMATQAAWQHPERSGTAPFGIAVGERISALDVSLLGSGGLQPPESCRAVEQLAARDVFASPAAGSRPAQWARQEGACLARVASSGPSEELGAPWSAASVAASRQQLAVRSPAPSSAGQPGSPAGQAGVRLAEAAAAQLEKQLRREQRISAMLLEQLQATPLVPAPPGSEAARGDGSSALGGALGALQRERQRSARLEAQLAGAQRDGQERALQAQAEAASLAHELAWAHNRRATQPAAAGLVPHVLQACQVFRTGAGSAVLILCLDLP